MSPLSSDIEILNQYNFIEANNLNYSAIGYNRNHNPELLAIKKENGTERLIKVKTVDLTLWNLISRIFGCGKLAHIDLTIGCLSKYLSKFEWKSYSTHQDKSSKEYAAYIKVCQIAGRQLMRNRDRTLWNSLSTLKSTKLGMLYLNPVCTLRHLYFMQKDHKHWNSYLYGYHHVKYSVQLNGKVYESKNNYHFVAADGTSCITSNGQKSMWIASKNEPATEPEQLDDLQMAIETIDYFNSNKQFEPNKANPTLDMMRGTS